MHDKLLVSKADLLLQSVFMISIIFFKVAVQRRQFVLTLLVAVITAGAECRPIAVRLRHSVAIDCSLSIGLRLCKCCSPAEDALQEILFSVRQTGRADHFICSCNLYLLLPDGLMQDRLCARLCC